MASNPESSLFFDSDTLKKINESALISQTHSTGSFWPVAALRDRQQPAKSGRSQTERLTTIK